MGGRCALSIADRLRIEVTFAADGEQAQVIIGIYTGGPLTVQCPNDRLRTLLFAAFWDPQPLSVPLARNEGCR